MAELSVVDVGMRDFPVGAGWKLCGSVSEMM